jgi:trimeric autotransporter adhesin
MRIVERLSVHLRTGGRVVALAVTMIVALSACDSDAAAPELLELLLDPPTATLEVGQTVQFRTRAMLSDGNQPDVPATYATDLGSITSAGLYSATGPGRATVTARVVTGETVTASVLVTEPPPVLDRLILVPDTARLQPSQAVQFQVTGRYGDGTEQPVSVTYVATGGTITATGRYTAGSEEGSHRVIARSTDGQADTSVVIISPQGGGGSAILTAIELSPPLLTLVSGSQHQYDVTGRYSDGTTQDVTEEATFNTSGGTITSPGGWFTAGSVAGTYRVIATVGSLADTATINVVPRVLIAVSIAPSTVTLATGTSQLFSLVGTFTDGSTQQIAATFTATGGTITSGGLYVAGSAAGTYQVIATAGARADTAAVTIVLAPDLTIQSVALTPETVSLTPEATQQYTVIATYTDGSTANITGSAAYSATGGTISSAGLYKAGSGIGSYRVVARSGTHADTAVVSITVAEPSLQSVSLTPASVSLAPGGSRQFTVTGSYSGGSTEDLTATAAYTATGGSITQGGRYTAGASPGTYRVIATSGSRADTASVTITAIMLQSVSLSPATVSLIPGGTQQFTVTGTYSDGTKSDLTPTATYLSSGGTITSAGLYTAGASTGSYQLTASAGSRADTTAITITASTPSQLAIECASPDPAWIWCDDFSVNRLGSYFEYHDGGGSFTRQPSIGVDGSHGMRATFRPGSPEVGNLKLAFGRTPDAYMDPADAGAVNYRDVYWRAYVRNDAAWSGGGGDKLVRGIVFADGNWAEAAIGHVWSGGADHNFLVLDPASGTDTEGNLQTTGYNDFGNMRWLGAVTGTLPLFNSSNVGTWRCVEAHMRLNDAGLSNGVFELWIDGGVQARKTGLNWLGGFSLFGINAIFFENYWNSSAPEEQSRYFDNIVVSTERVGCGGGSGGGSTPVAVVDVGASASTLATGATLQLTATPRASSGTSLARSVTWASSNASVLTVAGNGIVTGVAAGSATVLANSGGKTGSLIITVTAAAGGGSAVASVAVAPASNSIPAGGTQQLSATARDASGTTIPGKTFSWSSADATVASVNANGMVTAIAPGNTTITASADGKSGSAAITVTAPAPTPVASVSINPTSATLSVGGTQQYTATPRDAGGNALVGRTVTWSSSDPNVASISGAGLATAMSSGSASIRATVDGVTGQATLTVASGGGGSVVQPFLVEDFSTYSSTSEMLANPRGIYVGGSEDVNRDRIVLDKSVGFGGASQSMRYDYPALGSVNRDYTISRALDIEDRNLSEVWVEIAFRFSPNWSIDAGASGGEAFKLLHIMVSLSSGSRFGLEFENGNGGSLNAKGPGSMYILGSGSARTPAIFDGNWHVARFHVRAGSNGMMELWVDGDYQGSRTGSVGSNRLFWVFLASNLNQGPLQAQNMWWGSVKAWDSNPGW